MISIVVATGKNNAIGIDNQMPWHLPADLRYFKDLTTGHPVIMGRKTFESIGKPLPNRRNIVISRISSLKIEDCEVVSSLEEAIALCDPKKEIMIIGGSSIYELALPKAHRIYRTLVDVSPKADKFFPEIDVNLWHQQLSLNRAADEKNAYDCTFEMWERKAT
jgi:dihydrofolate reductase